MLYLVIALVVLIMIFAGFYNSFVVKRNNVDNAFSAIDTQLKKRCDLVPNLVAAVKAYMKHENGTLLAITQFRSQAAAPGVSAAERMELDNKISRGIHSLMVQLEAYPDLKASESFMHLQRSMTEIEEQLSASRRAYNAAVTVYNNAIMLFPGALFAGMYNFKARQLFEAAPDERNNPNVSNLFQ
ncbi:MAG: LemA family protein [Victivallaceae bacterium]